MDRELIKKLYSIGDTKRKKVLYEEFKSIFQQKYSVEYTVAFLNQELGEALVTKSDVKYVREHFVNEVPKTNKSIEKVIPKPKYENESRNTVVKPLFDSEIEDLFDDSKIAERQQKAQQERAKNRKW